jgi:hypothetical protein
MTPNQIIEYFGSVAKAVKATGITRDVFYQWRSRGFVPLNSQWELKHDHGVKLKIGKPYCKGDL